MSCEGAAAGAATTSSTADGFHPTGELGRLQRRTASCLPWSLSTTCSRSSAVIRDPSEVEEALRTIDGATAPSPPRCPEPSALSRSPGWQSKTYTRRRVAAELLRGSDGVGAGRPRRCDPRKATGKVDVGDARRRVARGYRTTPREVRRPTSGVAPSRDGRRSLRERGLRHGFATLPTPADDARRLVRRARDGRNTDSGA